jgi:hypothetical protein
MKQSAVKEEKIIVDGMICLLLNSTHFFIHRTLVINENGKYRLLVMGKSQIFHDSSYETLRGAKIAFSRIFSNTKFHDVILPRWSDFYEPDEKWLLKLQKRMRIALCMTKEETNPKQNEPLEMRKCRRCE